MRLMLQGLRLKACQIVPYACCLPCPTCQVAEHLHGHLVRQVWYIGHHTSSKFISDVCVRMSVCSRRITRAKPHTPPCAVSEAVADASTGCVPRVSKKMCGGRLRPASCRASARASRVPCTDGALDSLPANSATIACDGRGDDDAGERPGCTLADWMTSNIEGIDMRVEGVPAQH